MFVQGSVQRSVRVVLDGADRVAAGRVDTESRTGADLAGDRRDNADAAQPGRVHGALRQGERTLDT